MFAVKYVDDPKAGELQNVRHLIAQKESERSELLSLILKEHKTGQAQPEV
jgi:hypothetical protein